mgnify:CR=1 FL=1
MLWSKNFVNDPKNPECNPTLRMPSGKRIRQPMVSVLTGVSLYPNRPRDLGLLRLTWVPRERSALVVAVELVEADEAKAEANDAPVEPKPKPKRRTAKADD